jgi:hypothetical protein
LHKTIIYTDPFLINVEVEWFKLLDRYDEPTTSRLSGDGVVTIVPDKELVYIAGSFPGKLALSSKLSVNATAYCFSSSDGVLKYYVGACFIGAIQATTGDGVWLKYGDAVGGDRINSVTLFDGTLVGDTLFSKQ